jgi:hypothetical protein
MSRTPSTTSGGLPTFAPLNLGHIHCVGQFAETHAAVACAAALLEARKVSGQAALPGQLASSFPHVRSATHVFAWLQQLVATQASHPPFAASWEQKELGTGEQMPPFAEALQTHGTPAAQSEDAEQFRKHTLFPRLLSAMQLPWFPQSEEEVHNEEHIPGTF